jgi:hypothetical protein
MKPVDKKGRMWRAVRGRSDKVPGRRQAVNEGPKTALSGGVEVIGFPKRAWQIGIF